MNKKILIADEHYVVRLGTAIILKNKFANISVDFAENYNEIKKKLYTDKFDLIILDIEMYGNSFIHMLKELRRIQKDIIILIFSSQPADSFIGYSKNIAEGYVSKGSDEQTFLAAIDSIFENGYYYPKKLIEQFSDGLQQMDIKEILSIRELEVLKLLLEGKRNLEINKILNIQTPTTSTYKRRIYAKLKVDNLMDLLKVYKEQNVDLLQVL